MTQTPLGDPAPNQLDRARLALHYAAQPFAAASYALHAPRADHSQTNLLWSNDHEAFVGRPLADGRRLVFDPIHLRTGFLEPDGERRVFDLAGLTLEESFTRFEDLARSIHENLEGALELPAYDLPDAPYAEGSVFPKPDAATAELVRWFASADTVLRLLSDELLEGGEVRGWPHHFDLAVLQVLDEGADPEIARSLNVGFSPGDASIAQPYYYVTPWPAPDAAQRPRLHAGGRWHTDGFTAIVVTATELVEAEEDALGLAAAALREAIRVARAALLA